MSTVRKYTSNILKLFCILLVNGFIKSPAGASALLLYGILFGFILAENLSFPWTKICTTIYYLGILFLTFVVVFRRWKFSLIKINKIDLVFGLFVCYLIMSSAINFWQGTTYYLLLAPIFIILPYVLGRLMNEEDILKFWNMLQLMGIVLILLIPYEYFEYKLPPFVKEWPLPYLFGQPHGTMLSGQVISSALLVAVTVMLFDIRKKSEIKYEKTLSFLKSTIFLGLSLITVLWISARGSLLVAILGIGVLFLYSSNSCLKRKLLTFLLLGASLFLAIQNPYLNKNNRERYNEIIQSPPNFIFPRVLSDKTLNNKSSDAPEQILDKKACKNIANSIADRWIHYQTAILIFWKHPVIGVGANKYGQYSCSGPGWYPHSTILQVFAELGLLGAFLYAVMLYLTYSTYIRYHNFISTIQAKAVSAWLLAFLTFQLGLNQIYGNYFLSAGLYFTIGIASGIISIQPLQNK